MRTIFSIAALLLLAAPAQAEMLLATVTGGISGCRSEVIEDEFEFGTGNVRGSYYERVPFAIGTTNFTTGLDPLIERLFGPTRSVSFEFVMPGTVNHSVQYKVSVKLAKLWEDYAYGTLGIVPTHVETIQRVASLNGHNLAGTAYDLSRVEFMLTDVGVETLDFGDVVLYSHSAEFQMNLFSSVPEPTAGSLLPLALLWQRRVSRVRNRHKVAGVVA